MPFYLARGGKNVPAEVQRWQYFLLNQGFGQAGSIDGDFGSKTELATGYFQLKQGISSSGKLDKATLAAAQTLGYTVLPDSYYADRAGTDWPPKPPGVKSPTNAWRNQQFKCFKFLQRARIYRPDAEAIVITGSCDGQFSDWTSEYIVDIDIPQLKFARGYPGYVRCHKFAAPKLQALFAAWEQADLLHLVVKYEGCSVPRYKRGKSPGDQAHPEKQSDATDDLSNHSFGSAVDMNYDQNPFPATPALCGAFGSTRELVEPAAAVGFYWGGYFKDGNHFELAKVK